MKRLPLYGINKLKDINELSTDVFHSTLAYASMAYTYQQIGSLVDMMEIGTTVFKNRKVEGVIEKNKKFTSRSYKRYIQFLDNNIFQRIRCYKISGPFPNILDETVRRIR